MELRRFLSSRTALMRASQVRELLKWIGRDVISLGGGIPDPSSFPARDLREILDDILSSRPEVALQYAPTEGVDELREELARFMGRRGIKASADNVVVTAGSQEALELLARILIDKGDVVFMENPTYLGAIQAFRIYEPRMLGVPLDGEGMRVDVLEGKLKRARAQGLRVKAIYVIPTCQNPTGISLSGDRRKRLLELAEEYDFLVVEDDPYSYFVFEGASPPPLKSLDTSGRVIYLSTASKVLAPGLRVGWLVAEEELLDKVVTAKQAVTLQTSTLSQFVLLEALRRGVVERQLPRLRKIYRSKRDAMLEALDEYMPDGVKWTRPSGGMFVWLEVPEALDMSALLYRALRRYKVAYVPGTAFHVEGGGHNTARLSYSYPPVEAIREAIRRLASLISDSLRAPQGAS
ncbi:MAG: aminotransferase [Thermoprotei archaeon]|nr:PLP-dependent aminotransferase family protein [Thermoproteales archaeon]RLE97960.1 MAG: aminotransferase [Thermoprotei archaeon]